MIIELEMLHEKLARIPGFPAELKMLIEHLIISHHGQYEFGSPKLPMFPEALMLHYLDDLDSKMESMRAQFERDADFDSAWTGYNPSLARPLLNTQKFLEKKLKKSDATPAQPSPSEETVPPEAQPEATPLVEVNSAASTEPTSAAVSALDALQKKFASHKPTRVGAKTD